MSTEINYNYEDVLSAVNTLYSGGSVKVSELDHYLKGFQKSEMGWLICIQMLCDNKVNQSVFWKVIY